MFSVRSCARTGPEIICNWSIQVNHVHSIFDPLLIMSSYIFYSFFSTAIRHTHTHTYVYIYIFLLLHRSPIPKVARPDFKQLNATVVDLTRVIDKVSCVSAIIILLGYCSFIIQVSGFFYRFCARLIINNMVGATDQNTSSLLFKVWFYININ